jgi:hypothetical protein
MMNKIDYDKLIKETKQANTLSYTLAVFFAGACCFAPNILYGVLFGFATLFWILVGNESNTRSMVWELRKEMNK